MSEDRAAKLFRLRAERRAMREAKQQAPEPPTKHPEAAPGWMQDLELPAPKSVARLPESAPKQEHVPEQQSREPQTTQSKQEQTPEPESPPEGATAEEMLAWAKGRQRERMQRVISSERTRRESGQSRAMSPEMTAMMDQIRTEHRQRRHGL